MVNALQTTPPIQQVRRLEKRKPHFLEAKGWPAKEQAIARATNRAVRSVLGLMGRPNFEGEFVHKQMPSAQDIERIHKISDGNDVFLNEYLPAQRGALALKEITRRHKILSANVENLSNTFMHGIHAARQEKEKYGSVAPQNIEKLREAAECLERARSILHKLREEQERKRRQQLQQTRRQQRPQPQPQQRPQPQPQPQPQQEQQKERMRQELEKLLQQQQNTPSTDDNQPDALKEHMQEMGNAMKMNSFTPPQEPEFLPEDNDKFSPSMDERKKGGENAEKNRENPVAIIEPPIQGYLGFKIFDSFNKGSVEWKAAGRKIAYPHIGGSGSHTMTMNIRGTAAIALPRGCVLCPDTLQAQYDVDLRYDPEHGISYISSPTAQNISIQFRKDQHLALQAAKQRPEIRHSEDIITGNLKADTNAAIAAAKSAGPELGAQQLAAFVKENFEYSNDSSKNYTYKKNPALYFQKIDQYRKVDCDVAATFFSALCRRAGIPARMTVGFHVGGSRNGKTELNRNQLHAWAEIWNGREWLTIDPTPPGQDDEEGGDRLDTNNPETKMDLEVETKKKKSARERAKEVDQQLNDALKRNEQNALSEGELDELRRAAQEASDAAKQEMDAQLNENCEMLNEEADELERQGNTQAADAIREHVKKAKAAVQENESEIIKEELEKARQIAVDASESILHEAALRFVEEDLAKLAERAHALKANNLL